MAIDVYTLLDNKRKNRLYSLDEETISNLSDIFSEVEKRTGVSIDPYGNTRVYCDHLKMMASLISIKVQAQKKINKRILSFKDFLDKQVAARQDVLMVGD